LAWVAAPSIDRLLPKSWPIWAIFAVNSSFAAWTSFLRSAERSSDALAIVFRSDWIACRLSLTFSVVAVVRVSSWRLSIWWAMLSRAWQT
jgi:hypothetical protein